MLNKARSLADKIFGRGLLIAFCLLTIQACSGSGFDDSSVPEVIEELGDSGDGDTGNTGETRTTVDITDAVFTNRSSDCADYVSAYESTVMDIKNTSTFMGDVEITVTDTECVFTSNSVPNHNFNDESAAFAGGQEEATISEIAAEHIVTRTPERADTATALSQELKNAIFLNGVRLDLISAGCYNPTSPDAGDDGNVGIGCRSTAAWLLDPLGTEHKFGADQHNAHTQPEGLYHYHGNPNAMFDDNPGAAGSPVIGFAADGFPVYGNYFYDSDSGQVRKAVSGYTLKAGSRGTRSDTNPGGDYDGTYNDDWEFTDAGDLDECNGMEVESQYGYYVTDSYPWVMGCISGTPHESFGSAEAGGGMPPPPPAG